MYNIKKKKKNINAKQKGILSVSGFLNTVDFQLQLKPSMEIKKKKEEARTLLGVLVNGSSGKITKHKEKPVFKLVTGKAVNLGLDEEGRKCHAHFT